LERRESKWARRTERKGTGEGEGIGLGFPYLATILALSSDLRTTHEYIQNSKIINAK